MYKKGKVLKRVGGGGRSHLTTPPPTLRLCLNWNMLAFLPELSPFDLEHNSYKQKIKISFLKLPKL